jgi:hypothetical protein
MNLDRTSVRGEMATPRAGVDLARPPILIRPLAEWRRAADTIPAPVDHNLGGHRWLEVLMPTGKMPSLGPVGERELLAGAFVFRLSTRRDRSFNIQPAP